MTMVSILAEMVCFLARDTRPRFIFMAEMTAVRTAKTSPSEVALLLRLRIDSFPRSRAGRFELS